MVFSKKKEVSPATKTLLVDGRNLFYIMYAGSYKNDFLVNRNINGILFFLKKIKSFVYEHKYKKVVFFFDGDSSGILRSKIYPRYKSNRREQYFFETQKESVYKNSFLTQEKKLKHILSYSGYPVVSDNVVESDDMIAHYVLNHDENTHIATNDSDLYGLVGTKTHILYLDKKSFDGDYERNHLIGINNWNKFYQWHPNNTYPIKALLGDTSDNISGVKGLGIKTLEKIIDTKKPFLLDDVYDRVNAIKYQRNYEKAAVPKHIEAIIDNESLVRTNFKLVDLQNPFITEGAIKKIDTLSYSFDKERFKTILLQEGLDAELNTLKESFNNFINKFL